MFEFIKKIRVAKHVMDVIDDAKKVYAKNDATVDKIKEIVERIIVCFQDLVDLLPSVGKLIDDIKAIFKVKKDKK